MGRELLRPLSVRRALVAVLAVVGLVALPSGASAAAGSSLWTRASGSPAAAKGAKPAAVRPARFRAYSLDRAGMLAALHTAPGRTAKRTLTVSLPGPRGGFQRFAVRRAPIFSARMQRQYPNILGLAGRGIDTPSATVRVHIGPTGFHASVRGPRGAWYIDPYYQRDQSLYVSYFGRDLRPTPGMPSFVERDLPHARRASRTAAALEPTVIKRNYRLALLSDPSYAAYFNGAGPVTKPESDANVFDAKTALMERVNQVYQEDLGIEMDMIDDPTGLLNFDTAAEMTGANGPCGGAPCFTADDPTTPDDPADGSAAFCSGQTLEDTGTTLGQVIGAENFDIGHLALGLNGGGVADLGVVGRQFKAWGCTGIPSPVGDFYAIDYVAHEMGHQFSGNHTFNGNTWNCGFGNRNGDTSVEPGSGSSVMAYAGICRQDNLQPHSDPYFSERSFDEIHGYTSSDQADVDEVQNIGLEGFNGADSFQITGPAGTSSTVTRGTTYNNVGLRAAVAQASGVPIADIVIDRFGHSGELDVVPVPEPVTDAGFQVTFTTGQDEEQLGLTALTGVTDFVSGETVHGGPVSNQGDTAVDSGNDRPVVTAPAASFLPTRTPFSLTGSATDADSPAAALTYMWEQNDIGHDDGTELPDNLKLDGPLFRMFGTAALVSDDDALLYESPGENQADGNPTRVFPDMAQVLAGTTNQATGTCPPAPPDETPGDDEPAATPLPQATLDCYSEFLPTAAWVGSGDRKMHFRLTVRDGNTDAGGVGNAETAVTVVPTAGPFRVTAPAPGATLGRGEAETVAWDVARTNVPPLSVGSVRILMSINGGATFDRVLAASTPNDGSQAVTMPDDVESSAVRIMVQAVGNTFFDVSHGNAALEYAPTLSNDAPNGRSVNYSDGVSPVTISASDRDGDGSGLTAAASGLPAGLALTSGPGSAGGTRPGTRTFSVGGTTTAGPGTYPVTVSVRDSKGAVRTSSFPIVVTAENGMATYTGDDAAERRQGTATLAATVAEIADGSPGDIATATLTFSQRGRVLCGPIPVTRRADGTGTASCRANAGGGGAHPIDVNVGGNYTAATNKRLAGANPALCDSSVAITGLSRTGRRVRISGFTERRFAGRRVTLTAGGKRVARPKVKADGSFSARVKAPRGRSAGKTTYRARVAGQRSKVLRLGRPLTLTSVKRVAGGTRVRGRLSGRNHASRKLRVMRAISCSSQKRVKTIRTDRRGRFSVKLARPAKGTTVAYRLRTASGTPRSVSLPVVIARK